MTRDLSCIDYNALCNMLRTDMSGDEPLDPALARLIEIEIAHRQHAERHRLPQSGMWLGKPDRRGD